MSDPTSPAATAPLLQTPEAQAIVAEAVAQAAANATPLAPLVLDSPVKAGWRTTEFWVTVVANLGLVLSAASGALPPPYAALASAASVFAYNVSRGLTKGGANGAN